jgi:glycosyltransferase involved in cell wall biosynthesis
MKDKGKNDIIAVIPAYNEEISIGSVILRTKPFVSHIIVVDDGSIDHTGDIADLTGSDVIRIEQNKGKANAVMTGLARAKELHSQVVVLLDSDGQHNPDEIPKLIAPIQAGYADLVIGSRNLDNSNYIPAYRKFGLKILDSVTNMASQEKITDSQSGFRALGPEAINNFNFISEGYNLENDMINYFSKIGLRIVEVPISVSYKGKNIHKKNPLLHGLGIFGNLVGIIGYKRPLISFGIPGLILTVCGIIMGYWAFSWYYVHGQLPFGPTILTALLLIIGLLLIVTGLILNSLIQIIKIYGK